MDTVVALLSAVARALRGLFDMALMAVGVTPTTLPVTDAALLPMEETGNSRHSGSRDHETRGWSDLMASDGNAAPPDPYPLRRSVFNAWTYGNHED